MEPVTVLPLSRHDLEPDLDRAEQAAASFWPALGTATDPRGEHHLLPFTGVGHVGYLPGAWLVDPAVSPDGLTGAGRSSVW